MSAVPDIAIGTPERGPAHVTIFRLLLVLFLAAAGIFTYLLAAAPDSIPWSFFVASYVFLLGVSQFGIAFCAIMRICRAKWARPFYRSAEITTLAFFPFAIILFLIIFAYGKEHLFFWLSPEPGEHLSPWLDADFLLRRNMIAQLVFYGLAFAYFLMGLLPDVTMESTESGPGWRRNFYKRLWSLRQGRDDGNLKSNTSFYAPVVLIIAVIANTFIAWDFAMMLFPHYHSTVFPLYFILGNMLAGTASIVILGTVSARTLNLTAFFKTVQLKSMGIVITGFALFWIYMFWAQFFVTWFGNLPYETGPLWSRMFGHYAPYFWTMMFCVVGLPIASMIFAACSIIIVGVWLNRYLLVMPATSADHTPFSSAYELLLVGGLFAGFLLVYLLLIRVFPMISAWEMRDAAGEEGPAY
jgi:molybdopterin-containing oxidoreductase family membrane subunit